MKYIKVTLQTILIVFLLLAVFLVATSKLSVFGLQSMVVLTGSMEPTISVGSIVFVKNTGDYQPGDIITFNNTAGSMVTHRLVEEVDGQYKLKGDANEVADSELVAKSDVVGETLFYVPYVGRFSGFLKTPVGFVGFIVIPALIFVGYELRNIKREIEKMTEKRILGQVKTE